MNIKKEIENIRGLIHKSYYQSGVLASVVIEMNEATPHFCGEMDKLVSDLENAAMQARYINEVCYRDILPLEQKSVAFERHWAKNTPCGKVEVDDNGWLHITLNTLLPHCKQKSNPMLRDSLIRLLYGYKQNGGRLPYFERAILVIDEHCNIENRQIYDQDNKGWKVIPNALKGLVIADDDQFSLGIALISTWDDIPACHIYVMDIADAGAYFSLYHSDCGSYFSR